MDLIVPRAPADRCRGHQASPTVSGFGVLSPPDRGSGVGQSSPPSWNAAQSRLTQQPRALARQPRLYQQPDADGCMLRLKRQRVWQGRRSRGRRWQGLERAPESALHPSGTHTLRLVSQSHHRTCDWRHSQGSSVRRPVWQSSGCAARHVGGWRAHRQGGSRSGCGCVCTHRGTRRLPWAGNVGTGAA